MSNDQERHAEEQYRRAQEERAMEKRREDQEQELSLRVCVLCGKPFRDLVELDMAPAGPGGDPVHYACLAELQIEAGAVD